MRKLMRVPLDFNYPLSKVWTGYCPDIETFQQLFGKDYPFLMKYKCVEDICRQCKTNAGMCYESAPYCFWNNSVNYTQWYKDPPCGDGFQLWETVTEGSPISPVFATLDELCGENAFVFASDRTTKENWKRMLEAGIVYHQEGNRMFV